MYEVIYSIKMFYLSNITIAHRVQYHIKGIVGQPFFPIFYLSLAMFRTLYLRKAMPKMFHKLM
jgi:hypothetical protein